MLMKTLEPALQSLKGRRSHDRRRHAEPSWLPALRRVAAQPALDSFSAYPCTRIHGALFESEFYAVESDAI